MTGTAAPTPFQAPQTGQPQHRAVRWSGFLLLTVCLWVLLFKGCVFFTITDPKPVWTSGQSGTPPRLFCYLAFPVSSSVDVYDTPNGVAKSILGRAVAISFDEERGEWVGVMGQGHVRRADLTLVPPPGAASLTEAYRAAMRAGMGIEFVDAYLETTVNADGLEQLTFTQMLDDYNYHSTYRLANGMTRPEAFAMQGKGDAFVWAGRSLVSLPITIVLGVILTRMLRRWIVPRRPEAQPVTHP